MNRLTNELSPTPRLSRGKFWLYSLALWTLLYGIITITGDVAADSVIALLNAPFLIVLVIFCVRRLHDRNYSGWWLLVAAIPILGALWLVWQLAFRTGTHEANQWGGNPKIQTADYLVVPA
jgi:uncharacterized membrane protein YhaH (DUF805 family)